MTLGFSGTTFSGDYVSSSGATITILSGEIVGQTIITAVDDMIVENLEFLEVSILNVTGGALTGANLS